MVALVPAVVEYKNNVTFHSCFFVCHYLFNLSQPLSPMAWLNLPVSGWYIYNLLSKGKCIKSSEKTFSVGLQNKSIVTSSFNLAITVAFFCNEEWGFHAKKSWANYKRNSNSQSKNWNRNKTEQDKSLRGNFPHKIRRVI